VQAALDALTAAAESGQGNLLALSIDAIRLRATVGEVSDALEKVYGRHRADTQKVTGVYAAAYDSAEGWDKLKNEIAAFAEAAGPPPARDDRQAGPGRPRPRRQGGGHGLCRPGLRRRHGPAVPDARGMRAPGDRERRARGGRQHAGRRPQDAGAGHHRRAEEAGRRRHHRLRRRRDPAQDYDFLYDAGVKGIYGPGTPIPASAKDVLEQISKRACAADEGDDGRARRLRCWSTGRGAGAAPRDRQGHHAAGVHARRPPRAADEVLNALLPHTGKRCAWASAACRAWARAPSSRRWACS
jgi:methylmalonyl-CoA mutase